MHIEARYFRKLKQLFARSKYPDTMFFIAWHINDGEQYNHKYWGESTFCMSWNDDLTIWFYSTKWG
jgi:hypothetical protein